jgi:hypothetical protein
MKKHIAKGLIITFLLMAPGKIALAAETPANTNPGITPDSIFYFLDRLIEKIEIAIAFNPVDKAGLLNKIASERINEASTMASEGNVDLAKQAISDGQSDQAAVQNIVDSTATTPTDNTNDSIAIDNLTDQIAKSTGDIINQLKDILKNVPNDDKQYFQQAEQQEELHKTAVQAFVGARHNVNDARKALKEAQEALDNAMQSSDTANLDVLKQAVATAQAQYTDCLAKLQQAIADKQSLEKNKGDDEDKNNDEQDDNKSNSVTVSSQPAPSVQPAKSSVDSTSSATVAANTNNNSTDKKTSSQTTSFKNYGQERSSYVHKRNVERKQGNESVKENKNKDEEKITKGDDNGKDSDEEHDNDHNDNEGNDD